MLLVLKNCLIDKIKDDVNVVNALNLIAHSRRSGNHVVLGERKVIKHLAECEYLSEQSRSIYMKIYNQLPITREYTKNIYLSVEIFSGSKLIVIEEGKFKIIRLPVYYFTNLSILCKTVLLFEDINDSAIYKLILDYYLNNHNLENIKIDYEPRAGGGQNTHKVFSEIQKLEERFCLSILDSDRKAPKLGMGNTAKSVLNINDLKKPLCDIFILNLREVENLIPTLMYKEVFESDRNKKEAINFLEALDNSESRETRKYLDLKQGLTLEKIFKENIEGEFRKYWTTFITVFHPKIFEKCLNKGECLETNSCYCYVTKGFGQNILKEIEKTYNDKNVYHMISDELALEWNEIGSIITAWCCASSRIS